MPRPETIVIDAEYTEVKELETKKVFKAELDTLVDALNVYAAKCQYQEQQEWALENIYYLNQIWDSVAGIEDDAELARQFQNHQVDGKSFIQFLNEVRQHVTPMGKKLNKFDPFDKFKSLDQEKLEGLWEVQSTIFKRIQQLLVVVALVGMGAGVGIGGIKVAKEIGLIGTPKPIEISAGDPLFGVRSITFIREPQILNVRKQAITLPGMSFKDMSLDILGKVIVIENKRYIIFQSLPIPGEKAETYYVPLEKDAFATDIEMANAKDILEKAINKVLQTQEGKFHDAQFDQLVSIAQEAVKSGNNTEILSLSKQVKPMLDKANTLKEIPSRLKDATIITTKVPLSLYSNQQLPANSEISGFDLNNFYLGSEETVWLRINYNEKPDLLNLGKLPDIKESKIFFTDKDPKPEPVKPQRKQGR